ncbi:HAD family hydrolase [Gardnerella leopoldii]|uniref:alpha/beta hydrolase n=1 Tax=Gardnerella leopoldii TaxID=2792978 RepID=UPI00157450AF|nr:alpha/beta hydrolase [Gardnerella vaginalis]
MGAEIKAVSTSGICDIREISDVRDINDVRDDMRDDVRKNSIREYASRGMTDVVFDLQLLVDWDVRRTLDADYPDFIGEVLFSFEPEWGFEFHESLREAGWSRKQAMDSFDEHHGPAVTWLYRLYFERFERGFAGERADASAVARELIASGVRVWALGNASCDWLNCARKTCPILGELNGVCASYESHLRKPDVMLYRAFLQHTGLSAASTLFLESDSRAASAASLLYS